MKMSNLSKNVSRIFFKKKLKQNLLWHLKNNYPMKMQFLSLINENLGIETKTKENPRHLFS